MRMSFPARLGLAPPVRTWALRQQSLQRREKKGLTPEPTAVEEDIRSVRSPEGAVLGA